MKIEDDAVHAADDAHIEDKEGSDIATAPAASIGTAEPAPKAPGETMKAMLPGDTFDAKLDALHAKHFVGTELAAATTLWNKVMAFKEEVKRLAAEFLEDVEKL